jgi:hypothetical protein
METITSLTIGEFIDRFLKENNSSQAYTAFYHFVLEQNPDETVDEEEFRRVWLGKICYVWRKWTGGPNPIKKKSVSRRASEYGGYLSTIFWEQPKLGE